MTETTQNSSDHIKKLMHHFPEYKAGGRIAEKEMDYFSENNIRKYSSKSWKLNILHSIAGKSSS